MRTASARLECRRAGADATCRREVKWVVGFQGGTGLVEARSCEGARSLEQSVSVACPYVLGALGFICMNTCCRHGYLLLQAWILVAILHV